MTLREPDLYFTQTQPTKRKLRNTSTHSIDLRISTRNSKQTSPHEEYKEDYTWPAAIARYLDTFLNLKAFHWGNMSLVMKPT